MPGSKMSTFKRKFLEIPKMRHLLNKKTRMSFKWRVIVWTCTSKCKVGHWWGVHVCLWVRVPMCVHYGVCAQVRGQHWIHPQPLSTLFLGPKFLTNLELTSWAGVAVQETTGICRPLPSQHWGYRHSLPQSASTWLLEIKLRPSRLCGKGFSSWAICSAF